MLLCLFSASGAGAKGERSWPLIVVVLCCVVSCELICAVGCLFLFCAVQMSSGPERERLLLLKGRHIGLLKTVCETRLPLSGNTSRIAFKSQLLWTTDLSPSPQNHQYRARGGDLNRDSPIDRALIRGGGKGGGGGGERGIQRTPR